MDMTHFLVYGDMKEEPEKKTVLFFSAIIQILEKTGQEIFPKREMKSLKKVLSFYYGFCTKVQ